MTETSRVAMVEPDVGSYAVANYPPCSVWTEEAVFTDALPSLDAPPVDGVPIGLYLHIPFCKTRCHFCHFRVDTDRAAQDVEQYLDLIAREWALLQARRAVGGRPLSFVYFGGGTPSFLSATQLQTLVERLTSNATWGGAEEITFECEPGTLTAAKLKAIRDLGVTRLSLGVENFGSRVLELNGRAHRAAEITRAYRWARDLAFPQINVDLMAGMLGETDENWQKCIEKTLDLEPDTVTIYQMELAPGTTIGADLLEGAGRFKTAVANWPTRRRWTREAFDAFEAAGYTATSAYTAVKDPSTTKFVSRDRIWQGADLVALGVGSFGHVNGIHLQNVESWDAYAAALNRGELPLRRAYQPTLEERMIRELVLQLKRGWIRPDYFQGKYNVDVLRRFPSQFASLRAEDYLASATADMITLSREGLLRVDALLPRFFLPEHAGVNA